MGVVTAVALFVGVVSFSQPVRVTAADACDYNKFIYDNSIGNGGIGYGAETWETGGDTCGDFSLQVEGTIVGKPIVFCPSSSGSQTSYCYEWHPQYPTIEVTQAGYGWWLGVSKHWEIQDFSPYEWNLLGNYLNQWMDGGEPQDMDGEECEEGYYYDEFDGRCIPLNSPIIIPLTRSQNYKMTSVTDGVQFDINADGVMDRVSWTAADSQLAFLAMDRNGNGQIDNGSELFGNHTYPGANNGFSALAKMNMALNGNRPAASINADEPLYAKLLLWEDRNHNGISEPVELQPASNVVSDIGLGYDRHARRDGHGNRFAFKGWAFVRTAPGRNTAVKPNRPMKEDVAEMKSRQIVIYDVYLVTK